MLVVKKKHEEIRAKIRGDKKSWREEDKSSSILNEDLVEKQHKLMNSARNQALAEREDEHTFDIQINDRPNIIFDPKNAHEQIEFHINK